MLLLVLVSILPVVSPVKSHVTIQSGDVFELSRADGALDHVLCGVGLLFCCWGSCGICTLGDHWLLGEL